MLCQCLICSWIVAKKLLTQVCETLLLLSCYLLWCLFRFLRSIFFHILISSATTATVIANNIDYRYNNRTALRLLVEEMRHVIFKLCFEAIKINSFIALDN